MKYLLISRAWRCSELCALALCSDSPKEPHFTYNLCINSPSPHSTHWLISRILSLTSLWRSWSCTTRTPTDLCQRPERFREGMVQSAFDSQKNCSTNSPDLQRLRSAFLSLALSFPQATLTTHCSGGFSHLSRWAPADSRTSRLGTQFRAIFALLKAFLRK
jgi:hypothetical protein